MKKADTCAFMNINKKAAQAERLRKWAI